MLLGKSHACWVFAWLVVLRIIGRSRCDVKCLASCELPMPVAAAHDGLPVAKTGAAAIKTIARDAILSGSRELTMAVALQTVVFTGSILALPSRPGLMTHFSQHLMS